jgi:hypothetical protein
VGVDTSHFEASTRLDDVRADLFDRDREGLVPPRAIDQRLLEDHVPRNPDGSFQKFADPKEPWVRFQNDGGMNVPGRGNNCADSSRAFLETWYGNPRVSAARTPDLTPDGDLNPWGAEHDSALNQQRWAGADYQHSGPGKDGYLKVYQDLKTSGHGSSAVIAVKWPGEETGHAFTAVNYHGDVYWVDPQSGAVSLDTPLHLNAERVWHIPLDRNRVPIQR